MEWWEWLIIALAAATVVFVIGYRLFRRTRRGRAIMKLSMRERLQFGRILLSDRGTPVSARILLAILVGYLVLPFDLIPDFVPVVGHFDDLLVVIVVVSLVTRLVPGDRIDAAILASRTAAQP